MFVFDSNQIRLEHTYTRILIQLFRLPMLHLKLTTICQRSMVGLRSNGFGVQLTAGQN